MEDPRLSFDGIVTPGIDTIIKPGDEIPYDHVFIVNTAGHNRVWMCDEETLEEFEFIYASRPYYVLKADKLRFIKGNVPPEEEK